MLTLDQLHSLHEDDLTIANLLETRGFAVNRVLPQVDSNLNSDEIIEAIDMVLSVYLTSQQMKEFC